MADATEVKAVSVAATRMFTIDLWVENKLMLLEYAPMSKRSKSQELRL